MQQRSKPYRLYFRKQVVKQVGLLLITTSLLVGCTATKFLKEGESFYAGSQIKIDTQGKNIAGQKRLTTLLTPYLLPKPNSKILGSRPAVWFYYKAGTPAKKKGFRNVVRNKLAKPPVLLTDATPLKTAKTLEAEVNNNGYFGSTVAHEIRTKRKSSTVIYTVSLERPFRFNEVDYTIFDSANSVFYKAITEKSLVKENQHYSLERLRRDQERIEEVANNNGYYYFDDRYLLFEADSTVGKRKIDMTLQVEQPMPANALRIYTVRNINVYPNYTIGNDSMATTSDTLRINGFNYIDNCKTFRPEIIMNVVNMRPDSIYRRINHEYTISRLMSLKTFKFVNMKFTEHSDDSSSLDANIYLTPLLKKSVRMQVQGVSKSNNFVGPGFELTFTNRNLFRGAEMLQLKANTAYESQISRQQSGALNAIEFGTDASVSIPRFISPIDIRSNSTKYLPQTHFKIGYNFQERLQYFRLTSFNISSGYTWRETTLKTHELLPADITFVRSSKTSPEFDALLKQNQTLANSFQNQFIVGSRYSFTINTQLREDIVSKYEVKDSRKTHVFFNSTVDFSGNILNASQRLVIKQEGENPYQLFGAPYSQFTILSTDFRFYYLFSKTTKLATRLVLSSGFAYSNSRNLPYIKQFSVGGSNSIRAFPARSVGPGIYNVRTDSAISSTTYFIDQRGDIKMEANVEYRFDIYKALKGALFADAGNIWLWQEDAARPGAKFNKNDFIPELAVGTGAGMRYDFNFFVLRLDLAFPVRKPYLEENNRWVISEIDFGSKDWRRQNLIFNIAIGYPF